MLSRYYEIGRVAALSAADAHGEQVDQSRAYDPAVIAWIGSIDVMQAAYAVVKESDELLVSLIPEWEDMTADQRTKFCIGYFHGLKEFGK